MSVIARAFRDFANQRHDAGATFDRLVQSKADFWREAHLQTPAQLAAHVALGALQPRHGIGFCLRISQHADEDLRVAQVRAHLDIGHRGEPYTRVLELMLNDLADLLFNELSDSFGSVRHRQRRGVRLRTYRNSISYRTTTMSVSRSTADMICERIWLACRDSLLTQVTARCACRWLSCASISAAATLN